MRERIAAVIGEGAGAQRADGLDEPGPSEAVREGCTVLRAGLAWDAAPGLTLTLRAENLLDELYTPSAAAAVLAMGKQILLGAVVMAANRHPPTACRDPQADKARCREACG